MPNGGRGARPPRKLLFFRFLSLRPTGGGVYNIGIHGVVGFVPPIRKGCQYDGKERKPGGGTARPCVCGPCGFGGCRHERLLRRHHVADDAARRHEHHREVRAGQHLGRPHARRPHVPPSERRKREFPRLGQPRADGEPRHLDRAGQLRLLHGLPQLDGRREREQRVGEDGHRRSARVGQGDGAHLLPCAHGRRGRRAGLDGAGADRPEDEPEVRLQCVQRLLGAFPRHRNVRRARPGDGHDRLP